MKLIAMTGCHDDGARHGVDRLETDAGTDCRPSRRLGALHDGVDLGEGWAPVASRCAATQTVRLMSEQ